MKRLYRVVSVVLFSLALAVSSYAQQTGISGRVSDSQGAVIAGANVEVRGAGGGVVKTKTTDAGTYLVPSLTAGDYIVTITAPGFNTVQTKVSMLVGQTPDVTTTLPLASANDTVVVSAEDIAVDTTSSTVAGNITPDDVKDMPINGRNYMELSQLVPGVRVNAITNDTPLGGNNSGKFQINLDGLQVTQDTADASFGQPRFSPDAISQFQIITNRFDATLGRSSGVYVNVQSKTGSNAIHGTVFGYFRNDAFNAADPIAKSVTALSDQQYGGTFGGPIKKDKMWYFGSYEGEHQASSVPSTPIATNQTITVPQTITVNEYLGRGDWQPTQKDRIFLRGNGFTFKNNNVVASGTTDPSSFYYATRMNYGFLGDWNHQISSKMVNELHGGLSHFQWQNLPAYSTLAMTFAGVTDRPDGSSGGALTIGGPYNYPQIFYQNVQQYRDDLYYLTGKHSIKAGVEYMHTSHTGYFQQNVRGTVGSANCLPVDYKLAFPNGTTDPGSWNYTELNRACAMATFTQGAGNFNVDIPRNQIAFWVQDDWKVLSKLTVNLGVRYDNDIGAFAPNLKLNNGLLTPKSGDNNNFAPRVGFNYDLFGTGRTVIRGGAGIYYSDIAANQTIDMQIFNGVTSQQNSITGTAAAPLNLQSPFAASVTTPRQAPQPLGPNVVTPWGLQMTLGVQQQLDRKTVLTADYVHTRVYSDWVRLNSNLIQNPNNPQFNLNPSGTYAVGTALNCPANGVTADTDPVAGRPNVCAAAFTNINQFFTPSNVGSIYDALQMGIRHSLSGGFVGGVAYTYSRYKNNSESPFYYPNKPFVNGLKDEWANAQDDQRHTLTVNGNYQWKFGLSVSSLFHYGSGNAFPTIVGTAQPTGYAPSYNRTFAAGVTPVPYTASGNPVTSATCATTATSCVRVYNNPNDNFLDTQTGYWMTKRNALYGRNVYRLDTRLQERHQFGERYAGILAVEAFNLANHSNYGSYIATVTSSTYGAATQTTSAATGVPVEWRPRSLQFVARFEF
ncbi:MAG: TonB-dependent receptor [Edaphobacter sp.]|uniref:TonB-dependent receptor n=1 Tax=Edaphobacter sp. TaxID=1934404 RepID=UPI00238B0202|nr:TonB-dependent receptor [Edaphobacter sp.]MDE1176024.1 TonB-dependent receptor [Edaphobacter sp.]